MMSEIALALTGMASSAVGGLFVWLRTRKKDRYDEMKMMQGVYNGMVTDIMKTTEYKVDNLTNEVHMLRQTMEKIYSNCKEPTCKNYNLKVSHNENNQNHA